MLSQLAVELESVRFCKVDSPPWTGTTLGRALVGEFLHLEMAAAGEVAVGGAGGGSGG